MLDQYRYRKYAKRPKGEHLKNYKNMFCDLVYCADCVAKLWFNVNHPNTDIQYFNRSNYKGNRGTCNATHYIRTDSLEQIVKLELAKMIEYIRHDEETFIKLLAKKTAKDAKEQRFAIETTLSASKQRNNQVSTIYEKMYEDNVSGKIIDERFMQM